MTESMWLSIIVGTFNILAIVAGRWMSHLEHRRTALDVSEIKKLVNGRTESKS